MAASNSSASTSSSLLNRAKQDDPLAWRRLARCYGPVVYGWSRRAGLQESDAADVMQEVFSAVSVNLRTFSHGAEGQSFRGWLWTITRNKIRDHFRRRAKLPITGGSDLKHHVEQIADSRELPPTDEASDDALIRSRLLAEVEAEFPSHQWQAFWRVVVRGEKPAHVADELQISVWTVYQAKSRILRRLRQEFAGLADF